MTESKGASDPGCIPRWLGGFCTLLNLSDLQFPEEGLVGRVQGDVTCLCSRTGPLIIKELNTCHGLLFQLEKNNKNEPQAK